MGVESIVTILLGHFRAPYEEVTVMQCHYVVVFQVYRTKVTSRKLDLYRRQKTAQLVANPLVQVERLARKAGHCEAKQMQEITYQSE